MTRTALIESTSPILEADVDTSGGRLTLRGELDLATSHLVDRAAQLLLESSVREVVVHVDELRFIDAAGLGSLVRLDNLLRARGRRLCIAGTSGRIRKVFQCAEVTNLLAAMNPRSAPRRHP